MGAFVCLRLDGAQVTLAVIPDNGRKGALVPRFDNPTVLVTRPKAASDRFVAAVQDRTDRFVPLIAPAFETVPTGQKASEFTAAIFTSRAGVDYAPAGGGRLAFCVGNATADAAATAGYDAVSADGSVEALMRLILSAGPTQILAHIRGEVSRGNVSDRLGDSGLQCRDVVAYRKAPLSFGSEAAQQLTTARTLLLPLFSAETVSIIATWGIDLSAAHVVAISPFVADAAQQLSPASISTADHPNQGAMVDRMAAMIA